MSTNPPIVLMGLRASGKTTIGRLVAEQLGLGFVDLDDRTADRLDTPDPAEAIRTLGLDAFRDAETDALRDALLEGPLVIALGGGTPTAPGAVDLLRAHTDAGGALIYLHAGPSVLRARLTRTDTDTRPSLTGAGTVEEVDEVYLRRDPLYRDLCTRIIETKDQSPHQVARLIAQLITDSIG